MRSIPVILLMIFAIVIFTTIVSSLAYSFVKWEWHWFFHSAEGWRFFFVTAILGGGASR